MRVCANSVAIRSTRAVPACLLTSSNWGFGVVTVAKLHQIDNGCGNVEMCQVVV